MKEGSRKWAHPLGRVGQRQERCFLVYALCFLIAETASGQWQNFPARSQAMGGAGLCFQHPEALWMNPAALVAVPSPFMSATANQPFLLPELGIYSAGAAWPFAHDAWGVSTTYTGYDAFNQKKVALAYSRRITTAVSLGIQLDYFHTSVQEYGSSGTLTGEVGLLVAFSSQLHLGATLFNPYPVGWGFGGQKVPTIMRIGLGYQPASIVQLATEVEKDIDQPARIRLGVEYQAAPVLWLRAGLFTNPATACAGAGLRTGPLRLDFAVQYHQLLGPGPSATLVYAFAQKEKTKH
ncbi:MAG: hypothetical protein NZL95_02565 [Chitinophagales bacterium]|nr:hypothetical protein [Chitinophagales bacterium]MDW8427416.1 hypothetical protein [Chitinophagales bacterium]